MKPLPPEGVASDSSQRTTPRIVEHSHEHVPENRKLSTGFSVYEKETALNWQKLASILKLPQDRITYRILQFATFFTLPLTKAAMQELRTGVLHQQAASENIFDITGLALAAVIAKSKGIQLTSEALQQFARTLDPRLHTRQKTQLKEGSPFTSLKDAISPSSDTLDESVTPIMEKKENSEHGFHHSENFEQSSQEQKIPEVIIKQLQQQLQLKNDPQSLVSFLNQIPSANGTQLVVLPFSFTTTMEEYTACLRFLLQTKGPIALAVKKITLTLQGNNTGWSCLFEVHDKNIYGIIQVYPHCDHEELLRAMLTPFVSQLTIQEVEQDMMDFFPEFKTSDLSSIDEVV